MTYTVFNFQRAPVAEFDLPTTVSTFVARQGQKMPPPLKPPRRWLNIHRWRGFFANPVELRAPHTELFPAPSESVFYHASGILSTPAFLPLYGRVMAAVRHKIRALKSFKFCSVPGPQPFWPGPFPEFNFNTRRPVCQTPYSTITPAQPAAPDTDRAPKRSAWLATGPDDIAQQLKNHTKQRTPCQMFCKTFFGARKGLVRGPGNSANRARDKRPRNWRVKRDEA